MFLCLGLGQVSEMKIQTTRVIKNERKRKLDVTIFAYQIQTVIDIDACAADIWQVLVDFDAYPDWNPMLGKVKTRLEEGAQVRLEVLRDQGKPLTLTANITSLIDSEEVFWRGGNALVISGEHYFRIEELDKQHSRLHHGENFKGLLIPLLRPTLRKAFALYEAMNVALKQRVEQRHGIAAGE
jgi:hypothetical protein